MGTKTVKYPILKGFFNFKLSFIKFELHPQFLIMSTDLFYYVYKTSNTLYTKIYNNHLSIKNV